MIIRYASDLHLEHIVNIRRKTTFDILPPFPEDSESIMVIAGDMSNGRYGKDFLRNLCERFKYVIFIMGNHEYYGKDIVSAVRKYREVMEDVKNFILLDDEVFITGDICFIGSTLWTDFNNSKGMMELAGERMNDFRCITNSSTGKYTKKFTPFDSKQLHAKSVKFIDDSLKGYANMKTVIVVSHHLPSYACVNSKYLSDPLNGAYASNLNWLFEENKIDYWIHGHTHDKVKMPLFDTMILCEPNGYGSEVTGFNAGAHIEV